MRFNEQSYHFRLLLATHRVAQLQVCGYHHALLHGESWLKQVLLHDVPRHLVERAQVPGLTVDQDAAAGVPTPDTSIAVSAFTIITP